MKNATIKQNRYAFLDRDGTLIFEPQDTYQVDTIQQLRILPGVMRGLQYLINQGYQLVMVTNQDGLGTVSYPTSAFQSVQDRLLTLFEKNDITFAKILICPHRQSQTCDCRKPKLGLVEKMIQRGGIDKTTSFVCGDRKSDKQFAKNIGVAYIPMKTNRNFYEAILRGTYDTRRAL